MPLPWSLRNALDNRRLLGHEAVATYWDNMTPRQRNGVDKWLLLNRPDLLVSSALGTQKWRFIRVVEQLYDEYKRTKFKK